MNRFSRLPFYFVIAIIPFLFSCATPKPYTQEMMAAPEVLEKGVLDPFTGDEEWKDKDSLGVLYATNRVPADPGAEVPYLNERDTLLHLGIASVEVGDADVDLGSLEDIDFLKNSGKSFPIGLKSVTPFGPLDSAIHGLVDASKLPEDIHEPALKFAEIINRRLENNPVKDIIVYVHGVNTSFESPLLVASEMWHYLGYRGVFIAFSWPSMQNLMDYITDVDTAEYTAVLFRKFLEYLMNETDAEKIHILAFSAGTKLVSQALHQIGLMDLSGREETSDNTSLGRVVFTAGDVERQLFGIYSSDGLLEPIDSLTVYMSNTDKALDASKSIRKYPRLGQPWKDGTLPPEALTFIEESNKLVFINATGLEGVNEGVGHEYFRNSPWVSSDILVNLGFNVPPEKRGLVLDVNEIYWTFPDDYVQRLALSLEQLIFEKKLMGLPQDLH